MAIAPICVFVTEDEPLRSNWRAAFPKAQLAPLAASSRFRGADVVWLRLPYEGDIEAVIRKLRHFTGKIPILVALSDEPRDEEGLVALRAGASGYCNGYSSPVVLQQVAQTVMQGGVWLGQSLLQKLVAVTAQQAPRSAAASREWAVGLTEREQMVAQAVALGASNKEIADQLGITERTVKAHLTSAFEKLHVRDRLQLTLLVNGI
ncbi:MAG: response regulator transcription factor [Burkholderiales bacterium]